MSSADLTTTVGVSGGSLRLVNWIDESWQELQNMAWWSWLRESFTMPLVAGQDVYSYGDAIDSDGAVTRLKRWHLDSTANPPWIYNTAAGSSTAQAINFVDWPEFNNLFNMAPPASGAPEFITSRPNYEIAVSPIPNDNYVVTGEYMRSSQVLALDTDAPEMPEEYHMLIVWMAMVEFGYHGVAEEILARGKEKKELYLASLVRNQATPLHFFEPQA